MYFESVDDGVSRARPNGSTSSAEVPRILVRQRAHAERNVFVYKTRAQMRRHAHPERIRAVIPVGRPLPKLVEPGVGGETDPGARSADAIERIQILLEEVEGGWRGWCRGRRSVLRNRQRKYKKRGEKLLHFQKS
jgi:hypothetical protein